MLNVASQTDVVRHDALDEKIHALQAMLADEAGARSYFPVLSSATLDRVRLRNRNEHDATWYLNFASSNYLNLSVRPEVIEAGKQALEKYGSGANGAPILSGQYEVHEELQEEIAAYHGAEAAALFPTGYMANLGVISAVCQSSDLLAIDAKAHASIIDGAKLSRARVHAFRHNDASELEERFDRRWQRAGEGIIVIATETIFSMDGDICPLPEFTALRRQLGARLLLDDAHGVGVLGPRGRGGLDHFALSSEDVDFHVGTFSKTFCGIGGYVTGQKDLIEYLRFQSRSSLFSANIPPVSAACCLGAVRIAAQEGATLSAQLRGRAAFFRAELAHRGIEPLGAGDVPIVPVLVPDEDQLVFVSESLRDQALLVNTVRFPAVPRGQSRLRFVLNLGLSEEDLARSASIVAEALQRARRR